MSIEDLFTVLKGSSRSGNFGHSGRPGKIGGSVPKGTGSLSGPGFSHLYEPKGGLESDNAEDHMKRVSEHLGINQVMRSGSPGGVNQRTQTLTKGDFNQQQSKVSEALSSAGFKKNSNLGTTSYWSHEVNSNIKATLATKIKFEGKGKNRKGSAITTVSVSGPSSY